VYSEKEEFYIWSCAPILSSDPEKRLKYSYFIAKDLVKESAIYSLGNGKYVFLSFDGNPKDQNVGAFHVEEFDDLNEAMRVFSLYGTQE
jgi:hypothetical protein